MQDALIKIIKRQTIDSTASVPLFQNIFNDTFAELSNQLKGLGGGYLTWQQVIDNLNDKNISHLRNLVHNAAKHHISRLNGIIPDLTNSLETVSIPFTDYYFDILQSDARDRKTHQVELLYQTETLTLLDSVDDKLLLSFGDKTADIQGNNDISTFMLNISRKDIEIEQYRRI